TGQRRH
ncbi:hypothetical protein V3C99_013543, partial [Haemonchus contortus]